MTLDNWLEKSGQIFRKARDLETHLKGLATAAESVGCATEAKRLRAMAARAPVMADFFVNQLSERVQ